MQRWLLTLALCGAGLAQAESPTQLLRFPDIHEDRVVFVYAGDLYTAPLAGGTATRLTSHPGRELYPRFSPDGSRIAFSAEYNGTRQVFTLPATGGEPRQLTWYNDVGPMPPRGGTDNRVLDWSPDGRCILVRMNRTPWDERNGRPYCVPADGGLEYPLAVPESGGAAYSPDGQSLVFTPIDRDFRSWKRYRGGRAQDVWTYDLAANTSKRLTRAPATDHQPMWVGDEVFFVSDRALGTLNLYRMPATGDESQLSPATAFTDFDVLWPSSGPGGIVFEKGGSIWHFDPASGAAREVPIRVAADLPETQPRFVDGRSFIDSFALSPGGERVAFGTRGELFTVPAKHGATRNLSHSPDAREHSLAWSPDGQQLAFFSDASGEYELYVQKQDGSSAPKALTRDSDAWPLAPVWSPTGKHIAWADKLRRLHLVEVATGQRIVVDTGTHSDIDDYSFSPDGRWLAYVKSNASRNSSIWLYALDSAERTQLTADATVDRAPVFDPKGRWLYFLSDRDFNLTFSAYEFNFLYTNATRIYAAALSVDGVPFYPQRSDEVGASDAGKDKNGASKDAVKPLRIDVPGFSRRVQALKVPSGQYGGLSANEEGVFFVAQGEGRAMLRFIGPDDDEPKDVGAMTGYALSADGKKLLLRRGEAFSIVDARPDAKFDGGKLDLSALQLRIEPRREWRQLFVDGWRILRDVFYEPGMHGQDWPAIRAKYEPLLPHVASRADLDYLFQEIAGEANAGHVYVESGDQVRVDRKPGGLLGAELQPDPSGYVRIARIFAGENWDPQRRSPLTEPGVQVSEGELILAIDGQTTRGIDNVYRLLENKADRWVELELAARPEGPSRTVRVRTLESELNLRYLDWVAERRRMVETASEGRIGYIHVPNTAVEGSREMFKGLLAYGARDALIIDDRYNGGGFIPDRMVEWLARTPLNYWKQRGLEPNATPLLSHRGPKAMLINGLSSSGGDALPYYFRRLNLGPLIGTRTWGGLIGIQGGSNPRLADGGTILAASFRFLDTEGRWAVEDEGVAPDQEVIDRPERVAAGQDPSLEAAIAHLMAALERQAPAPVVAPAAPTQFPRE